MSRSKFVAVEMCSDGSIGSICSDNSALYNAFGYQLGRFPENGLSFLSNSQDEEDPNPLYYNWADIDNYEDVDDMYRSSDSTCGVGTRNGDDLGWFSLSDAVGSSGDALNVRFSGSRSRKRIFEDDDTSRLDCMIHSSCESNMQESSAIYNRISSPSNNYIEDLSKSGEQAAQEHDSKAFGYLQGDDTPFLCSVYSSSSDMASLDQPLTATQPENISLKLLSLHELYSSEGGQSMRSDDSRYQMYQHHLLEASPNVNPTKNECNGGINMSISANSDGSGEQENSSYKSDDISVGATSFHQLQLVMNQLDPRTKLCIRDSLYRLAWGAEQRNIDSIFAERRNMSVEMETDTNPIDRSIAHLLFDRTGGADQSVMAGEDALLLELL